MTAHWKFIPLGEMCDILDSKRKPVTKKDRSAGLFPYYGATGILDYVEDFIFDEKLVLIGEDGAKWGAGENTAFSVEGRCWVNNHAHVIRPSRNMVLDEWIIYYLNANDLSPFITGLTVPKLNQAKMREIPIPLPPLAEQKRIVAILDEAFEGIAAATANAEKNLANARELFDSYLASIFSQKGEGWIEKPLGQVAGEVFTGPFGSLLHKSDYIQGGVPLVNPAHIIDGEIVTDGDKTVDATALRRLQNYRLKKDDVIIGRRGEIGRCAVVTAAEDGWLCGTGCFFIRVWDKTDPFFLAHLLRSMPYRKNLEALSSGTTMSNLSNTSLSNLPICLPDIKTQQSIVAKAEALSSTLKDLEANYDQKLSSLAELKQSILQKAFVGELTAQKTDAIDTRMPEFSAYILAFSYDQHVSKRHEKTFGHVKAQKTLHLFESIAGIDLGRNPIKDAAGPNDFQHMLRAKRWAKDNQFFAFVGSKDKGYEFKKLTRYDEMIEQCSDAIRPYNEQLKKIIDLVLPMNSQQAEVFATVHAAWNNLLIDQIEITDQNIIREARDNWHPDKLRIPEKEFKNAIRLIRDKGLVPDGTAKRVAGQDSLL